MLKLADQYKSLKKEISQIEAKVDRYSMIIAVWMSIITLILFTGVGVIIGYSFGRRAPTQAKPKLPL